MCRHDHIGLIRQLHSVALRRHNRARKIDIRFSSKFRESSVISSRNKRTWSYTHTSEEICKSYVAVEEGFKCSVKQKFKSANKSEEFQISRRNFEPSYTAQFSEFSLNAHTSKLSKRHSLVSNSKCTLHSHKLLYCNLTLIYNFRRLFPSRFIWVLSLAPALACLSDLCLQSLSDFKGSNGFIRSIFSSGPHRLSRSLWEFHSADWSFENSDIFYLSRVFHQEFPC